ncbi:amino acid adenylation domain-containing protein [Nocardia sp. NBC_01009]|uniref:amino acid adenylation domain-containing protein n=1 Tax=Nocardia sp. NBC_01009 TaxID=2975996 RepID=UPI003865BBD4|nr:amino acid adenylation domain-containing protein [Nocardia sp. NBC_01009]
MTRTARVRPTRISRARATTLPQLIAAAVDANPAGTAIVCADATSRSVALSYAELDERSTRLARLLIERGIGPEDLVAVAMPRSLHSVLAVWAVAKTGAGFVPVDPNYPAERVAHMVGDSGVRFGLTVAAVRDDLPDLAEWLVIDTPDAAQLLEEYPADLITYRDRVRPLYVEHPAYVIYTSGSTGKPKGVVVTHAGLARFCDEQRAGYRVTRTARTLHFASPSFDASVLELLLALGGAATMVVVAPTVYGGAELATVLRREAVTHAFVTPAALASVDPAGLDELAVVIVGGDVCPPELVRRWALPIGPERTREFCNGYGPTETTIMTNISAPLVPGAPVTIGAAIRGVTAHVLNDRLRPVPDRVIGELYLAGAPLARGYHGQPALTAARFVADPFDPAGGRLYRTGDLVRRTPSGELEYLGRNDSQVKIRGFRIELGEIDAVLASHPHVDFAVTVGHRLDSGATVLASYVHAVHGMPIDTGGLAALAEQALPAHMVPAAITVLDAVPLTSNGKLDRTALPAPVFEVKAFRAPSTPIEEIVAGTFGDVLGVARVGLDDNFFDLGGNSLLASQVTARLDAALNTRLAVRDLFDASTVGALALLVERNAGSGRSRPRLVAGERPERIPLSLAQQRYWFLNQYDTATSAVDNIPLAVRLSGALDVVALGAAIGDVLIRHEVLRTTYPSAGDHPHQVIHPVPATPFALVPFDTDEADLVPALIEFALTTFDVTVEVPLAMALFRLSPDEHVVAFVVHHVAADGASMGPLARDLMLAYAARVAGNAPQWLPLPVQYADYALWERAVLGSEDDPESLAAQQITYWQTALAGLADQLELPTDRPRPPAQSYRGKSVRFEISPDRHARLHELARAHHASLFMVAHAALAVLLARLSGSADVVVGTPIAGRGERELDDLIGMFVNTLIFRASVGADERFSDLLVDVRERDLEAFANADVPFERIVEALNPARSTARNPLFQVGLSFQNLAETALQLPGLSVGGVEFDLQLAKTDLHISLHERYAEDGTPAEIVAEFGYATDLFDESTVRGFADRFVRVLDAVIADPEVVVGAIDLLTPEESTRILAGWNDTAHAVDPAATLVSLLDATVATSPGAVALVADEPDGRRELTYAELDARVNRLARYLIGRGVGPEDRVALAIRRSADLVVAMYAVAKSGAVYVPVDPDQPADRVDYILDTAGPVCVLTTANDGFVSAAVDSVAIDEVDLSAYIDAPVSADERRSVLTAANTAYVIFTSGSTGQPKGVAVSHGAIVNQLLWKADEFGLGAEDAVLLKTAATFDLSVWEFWSAAVCGGRVVIAAPDGHHDPAYLNELMAHESVTTLHVVPSMLDVLLVGRLPGSLRRVLAIGEALPAATAQRFRRSSSAELFNLYGPTEAAVSITNHRVTDADSVSVSIGAPEWNSRVFVLDARLRPVPVGVSGELYLAGAQLARGYVGRADSTAERFVANPFGSSERMYRTGDLVAWNAAGELEYRGRTDFQVKIRGFRIEPGEIEAALLALPQIAQAAVIALSDPRIGDRLIAYLVAADPGSGADVVAVQAALSRVLPSYLVPSAYVTLDALPLTANGKLDRTALPEPEFETRVFRAVSTPIEEIVAGVFAEVLGVERVGADDDFFALGGNSLLATQAAARVGAALDTRVLVRQLFEAPTVAGLAAKVEQHVGTGGRLALVAGTRPERIPLSLAQLRMWFLNQFDTDSAAYNIPVALRLSGELDIAALHLAVRDLVARHEVLRTLYPQTPDGPIQQVLAPHEVPVDLAPVHIAESEVGRQVQHLAAAGFDVSVEVAFRATLFQVDDDEYILVFVAHHIGADGWSMGPLVRDVMLAYSARSGGAAPAWTQLPVQYADYGIWQRALLGTESDADSVISVQAGYWRTALAGLPGELNLPTDRTRPPVQSFAGGTTDFVVDAQVFAGLRRLAREHNATMFMVVHAALAVFLARLSGSDDIAIGTAVAGRGEAELDDMIGMFVNTLVLRTQVSGELTFGELLARTKDADLQAFAHADLPFERLVELLEPPRSTARHPLFQVALSFLNLPDSSFELPGLSIQTVDFDITVAPYDLALAIRAAGDGVGLYGEFTYARDLFDNATVRVFADRFTRLLAAIATGPHIPVGDLPLLDAAESALLTSLHGDRPMATGLLPDLLTRAVHADPEAIAVRHQGRSVRYRELDKYSSRLARVLIDRGVGPESLVALAFPRSYNMVAMVWAVAKAGGAYLPIDPTYPEELIRHMVTDSGAIVGVTAAAYAEELPGRGWLVLDDPGTQAVVTAYAADPVTDRHRLTPLRPQHPAYVIYTSGSTGIPKGVTVTHAGLGGLIDYATEVFAVAPRHRFLHLCSPSFDPSVLEWLCAFHTGATLVIAPPAMVAGQELAELLRTERVTHAICTPAVLGTVDPTGLSELEFLCVGGDVTTPELVEKWQPGRRYVNGYGPTEATVAASYGDLHPGRRVTIGKPVRGMSLLVLDSRLRPVPPGVAGELYLAGAALARGYHNRAGLTAQRFVADPWGGPGARMCRTGDVVRWYAEPGERAGNAAVPSVDWELDWVGRSDFQVKIRGFRIELGEIDVVLASHDDVEFAVTLGRDTRSGEKTLVAYTLAAPGRTIDTAELAEYAASILPAHMVPAAVVVLDELPLTPVGKLDRAALPEPDRAPRQYLAPSTPLERVVAEVFAEVLGVERIGADDDFFALGGSSLVATRAASRLRAETGAAVRVQWFFTDATVAALARRIGVSDTSATDDAASNVNSALEVLLPIRAAGAAAPLFCIHPMAGLAWCYAGLGSYVPRDRPIFGLQSPALSEPGYLPDSLDSMVRRYVTEIRAVQPEGPYHLLGWSLGGTLAHAVAVELQAEGAQVALLALLDGRTGGNIADFRAEIRAAFAELGIDAFPGTADLQALDDAALAALHAAISPELAVLTKERLGRIYRAAVRSVELAVDHRHRVFQGRLDYFTAAGHETEHAAWQPYVAGAIVAHPVPARHEQLTSPEALDIIGPQLTALLDRQTVPSIAMPEVGVAPVFTTAPGIERAAEAAAPAAEVPDVAFVPVDAAAPGVDETPVAPTPEVDVPRVVVAPRGTTASSVEGKREVAAAPEAGVPGVAVGPMVSTASRIEGKQEAAAAPEAGVPGVAVGPMVSTASRIEEKQEAAAAPEAGVPGVAVGPMASTASSSEGMREAAAAAEAGVSAFTVVPRVTTVPNVEPLADATPRGAAPEAVRQSPRLGEPHDDAAGPLPLTPNAVRLLEAGVEVRAIVIEVPSNCSAEAVQSAVDTVLEQHPMLWVRLRRDERSGAPVFEIPAADQRLDEAFLQLDATSTETAPPLDDVVREVATELDPAHGRNIRFVLIRGQHDATLVVVANGLVVDDASWRTIIDKLSTAWWRGRHATPAVPESGLRELLRELSRRSEGPDVIDEMSWWQDTLGAVPATLNPVGDSHPRSRRRVSLTITAEGTAAVAVAAAAYQAEVEEVLLTAVALALVTAAGETVTRTIGPVIRLAADARSVTVTDTIVGGFTTDYPLPLWLDGVDVADALIGGPAAGVAIGQVRELRRSAPGRGVGYGVLRYLNSDTGARLRALPRGRFALRYRDLRPARVHSEAPSGDLLLDLTADATAEGMLIRFDYAADVFGGDEVKTFAEHWIRALGGLAEHGQQLMGR